jgi:hypothetical protein
MEPLKLLEIGEIYEIVSRETDRNMVDIRLEGGIGTKWFLNDGLLVEYKVIGNGLYTIHTYGSNSKPVKKNRRFFIQSGIWMLNNTDCKEIIVFCPKDRRELKLLLASFATPSGETTGYYVYSFGKKEEGELCRQ